MKKKGGTKRREGRIRIIEYVKNKSAQTNENERKLLYESPAVTRLTVYRRLQVTRQVVISARQKW